MDSQPSSKRDKPKKAATLTMRLTQHTRDRLQAAAEAEGRSLSEMAERWLDLAAQGEADVAARLGGGAMMEAMLSLAAFTKSLTEEVGAIYPEMVGVDPTMDLGLRAALVGGAARLFALVFPIRAHGLSTPDPNRARRDLMGACWSARSELAKIYLEAPTTPDLDTFEVFDRCASGDLRSGTISELELALLRLAGSASPDLKSVIDTTAAALRAYDLARQAELDALVKWTERGRLLAEATAGVELLHRARDAAIRVQAELPGSAFALGLGRRLGEVSIAALFEREQHITEAADQIAAKSE